MVTLGIHLRRIEHDAIRRAIPAKALSVGYILAEVPCLPVRHFLFMHKSEALTESIRNRLRIVFDDSRSYHADLHKEGHEFSVCFEPGIVERA
jgi:hypothetical protein